MRRLTIEAGPEGPARLLESGLPWATVLPGLLETGTDLSGADRQAPRLIVRSGRDVTDAESAFASWSDAGWRAFDDAAAALLDESVAPVLIWPGAGSVLSDAVSTLSFARRQPGVGLMADPVAWIGASMAKDAEDHLARFAQAMAACPTVACVVVRPCEHGGLDTGVVAAALSPLLDRFPAAATPADHERF